MTILETAMKMFNAYNEQGPNPWKTWDGKDVPRWEALSEQVQLKWTAAADASVRSRNNESGDVLEFMRKFGQVPRQPDGREYSKPHYLTRRKLMERVTFMAEELDEFVQAVESKDMEELADALVDLVYVAKGTANLLGLPWKELWDDVHRANMAKVRGVGKRGNLVDCVKPPFWVPPQTSAVLEAAGYDYSQTEWDDPEYGGEVERTDNHSEFCSYPQKVCVCGEVEP